MEIISVVKQETTYTLSFTEEELKVVLAGLSTTTNASLKETLHSDWFSESFNTKSYTEYEIDHVYRIYVLLYNLLKIKP